MLQKLNERIQGMVAWVIIILIAITFGMFGIDSYFRSHQASDAEVVVNDEAISKQALETNYRRSRMQRDPSKLTAASESALKKKVLDEMVINLITVQAARNAGFQVSDEQANSAIVSIPQFQQDGHFSKERFDQALGGAMFTRETFRNEVKQGMLINQQRFAFIGSAFALPSEIERFVKLYMQTRDYDYLQISTALFMDKSKISNEQVSNFYKSHHQEFITPEKVSIDFIRLSLQQIRDTLQIPDADIQAYYNDNQSNFLSPASWKVAHILFAISPGADKEVQNEIKRNADAAYQALINNPQQFSKWVKTMSSDKLSKLNDGVLPWISAGQPEFDKALFQLTSPGQISVPLKTKRGYEIFKLIAFKPSKLKPLAEVKSQIADQLKAEAAQNQYTRALEQLSDLSYQSPDSLSPITNQLKLALEHTEPFSREGGNTEITKNIQVINTAFSHDVMELKNNSEPISLDNDSVVVLRVNRHFPATTKPENEVRDSIINKLAMMQAETKAKELGTSMLSLKEKDSEAQKAIIDSKQLVWRSVTAATRDSDKTDAMINDLAFSLSGPDTRDGRKLMNGDFVIVRLKKINDGNYNTLDKEHQASLTQQIENSYGLMDYDLYVNSLFSKAKIVK